MSDRPSEPRDDVVTRLLADPATWVEPRPGLEDAVVQAVTAAGSGPPSTTTNRVRTRGRRPRLAVVAAAAAIFGIVVVGAVVLRDGGTAPGYDADLTGTELAVGAHGTAEITETDSGFFVALEARGLPTLPEGEFYEAWFRSEAGTLVPIGTFSGAKGPVILWSGVSPDDFPGITVTIEPVDDDQTSSGRRVLVGQIRET